jgi:hypothetical protein
LRLYLRDELMDKFDSIPPATLATAVQSNIQKIATNLSNVTPFVKSKVIVG